MNDVDTQRTDATFLDEFVSFSIPIHLAYDINQLYDSE